MEQKFRIVFHGALQANADPALVRQRVGTRLKARPEQVETLFSGARVILKKNLTLEEAKAYQRMLHELGMLVALESMPEMPQSATSSPSRETRETPSVILSEGGSLEPGTNTPDTQNALVNTLAALDFTQSGKHPRQNAQESSRQATARKIDITEKHTSGQGYHAAPPHSAEAPLLFRTSIICGECGTRHIIEGRLLISVIPVDEPPQKDRGLR